MPVELKEALEEAATRNQRSLGAEVVYRLVHSFRHDPGVVPSWERGEMLREKDHLTLLGETLKIRRDALTRDLQRHERTVRLVKESNDSEALEAVQETWMNYKHEIGEVEAKLDGIAGRLSEIETDLKLPGIPGVEGLMAKMPHP